MKLQLNLDRLIYHPVAPISTTELRLACHFQVSRLGYFWKCEGNNKRAQTGRMLDLQLMSLGIRRLIPSFDNTQLRPRQRSKGKGAVACFTFVRAKVQLKTTGERQ